jgi:hypothetical protein
VGSAIDRRRQLDRLSGLAELHDELAPIDVGVVQSEVSPGDNPESPALFAFLKQIAASLEMHRFTGCRDPDQRGCVEARKQRATSECVSAGRELFSRAAQTPDARRARV